MPPSACCCCCCCRFIDPFCGLQPGAYNPALSYSQQGPYVQFCTYGGRSFSILDTAKNGSMLYDSGDDFEVRRGFKALKKTLNPKP